MDFREIVETMRQATQFPVLDQSGKGLIDRGTPRHIEEITRREDTAAPAGTGALHDPIGNRCHRRFHVSENSVCFSDIQGAFC